MDGNEQSGRTGSDQSSFAGRFSGNYLLDGSEIEWPVGRMAKRPSGSHFNG
jgi:hypothetical protein